MDKIKILRAEEINIHAIAIVNRDCFPFDTVSEADAVEWIKSIYKGSPRLKLYIAKHNKEIIGYISWMEKGGIRPKAILELDQMGVHSSYRGKGVGKKLIRESLTDLVKKDLLPNNRTLEMVLVMTGASNDAQKLYKSTLNAQPECIIKNLYGDSNELLMIARNINL
jgi:ribosomal protein S18 acetylase RimI-like enzyme